MFAVCRPGLFLTANYPNGGTDAGPVHLEGLTGLGHLDLKDTQVTAAGLVHLEGLTNLKSLDLRYTQVSDAGVARLKRALPNCMITK